MRFAEYLIEGKDFSKKEHSTTTARKLKVIKWEYDLLTQIRKPSQIKHDECLVGVVGYPGDLKRHIKQWEQLGYRFENLYIAEIEENIYEALKQYAQRYWPGLADRIFLGDIKDIVKELAETKNITHIDFDGTDRITMAALDADVLFKACPTLRSLVIVKQTRTGRQFVSSGFTKKEKEQIEEIRNKLRDISDYNASYAFNRIMRLSTATSEEKETADRMIQRLGVDVRWKVYKGVKAPMISYVIAKDTNWAPQTAQISLHVLTSIFSMVKANLLKLSRQDKLVARGLLVKAHKNFKKQESNEALSEEGRILFVRRLSDLLSRLHRNSRANITLVAKQLGTNASTLERWHQQGKIDLNNFNYKEIEDAVNKRRKYSPGPVSVRYNIDYYAARRMLEQGIDPDDEQAVREWISKLPRYKPSMKSLADKYGVNYHTLKYWWRAGIDVYDENAVRKQIQKGHKTRIGNEPTMEDIARENGVSRATLYRWMRKGYDVRDPKVVAELVAQM